MSATRGIPPVLWAQFTVRCVELGKTPIEAVREWLDNNPPPPPKEYSGDTTPTDPYGGPVDG